MILARQGKYIRTPPIVTVVDTCTNTHKNTITHIPHYSTDIDQIVWLTCYCNSSNLSYNYGLKHNNNKTTHDS